MINWMVNKGTTAMKLTLHHSHSINHTIKAFISLAILTSAAAFCIHAQNAIKPDPKANVVVIETSGYASVNGITYTNQAARDAVFRALASIGYTNGLRIAKVPPTSDLQLKVMTETFDAAVKTGLLPKRDESKPSPYE